MSDCLHCDINEIVQKHVEATADADAAEVAAKIAESLADFIAYSVAEGEQTKIMAHAIAHLGEMYLEKCGASPGDTTH